MIDNGLIVAVVDDRGQKHNAPNAGGVWVDFCAKADGVTKRVTSPQVCGALTLKFGLTITGKTMFSVSPFLLV